jgi:hypothetical protein
VIGFDSFHFKTVKPRTGCLTAIKPEWQCGFGGKGGVAAADEDRHTVPQCGFRSGWDERPSCEAHW